MFFQSIMIKSSLTLKTDKQLEMSH